VKLGPGKALKKVAPELGFEGCRGECIGLARLGSSMSRE